MSTQVILGVVKNGLVVPHSPLPEGADVEIHVRADALETPPDLQEELDAWQRARANAFQLVDSTTEEGADHAQR